MNKILILIIAVVISVNFLSCSEDESDPVSPGTNTDSTGTIDSSEYAYLDLSLSDVIFVEDTNCMKNTLLDIVVPSETTISGNERVPSEFEWSFRVYTNPNGVVLAGVAGTRALIKAYEPFEYAGEVRKSDGELIGFNFGLVSAENIKNRDTVSIYITLSRLNNPEESVCP